MQTKVVECPSGLVLSVREFLVKDEDLLADAKAIRQGVATVNIMKAITTEVVDFGPYQDNGGRLNWKRVLQGDSMAVLLANRIETWGYDYVHRQPCGHCRQPVVQELDLREMEVKKLPESSIPHVREGTPLGCTLPSCGKRVEFKLLRCEDDKAMAKIQRHHKTSLSSSYMRYRITGAEGVKAPDLGNFVANMSGKDLTYLRAQMDEADCGVQQEIELECDSCYHVWPAEVRFTGDFLFPKHRLKKTKKTEVQETSQTESTGS